MVWLAVLCTAAAATAVWWWLVPRLRIDDPEAPDFAGLVTGRSVAVVAVCALAVACLAALLPADLWWLWLPYLGFGLPLVAVDLRTTFLPLRLHLLAAGAMTLGLVGRAVASPASALAAVLGGAAAFGVFALVGRFGRSLGFGDVRLAALVGAVAGQSGPTAWAAALFAGTLLGALHAVAHAAWASRREGRPRHFPYGPALWLGPPAAAVAGIIAG